MSWPETLEEAVGLVISELSEEQKQALRNLSEEDLGSCHFGLGMWIRNSCGLWAGNQKLLKSCGSELMHPDEASMIIVSALWKKLRHIQPSTPRGD